MKTYDLMLKAYKEKYAIPQFNIANGIYAKFILEECERLKSPVIIGVSHKVAKHLGGFTTTKSLIASLKKDLKLTIPIILHFDHGKTIELCEEAIELGFDSVMLDYSLESLEKNIEGTKFLTKKYKKTIIESEIGNVGKEGNQGIVYAEVSDILKLSIETKAHLIAPAIGNVHGPYQGEPKIDLNRLKEINETIKKPLVLHGGSGLSDEIFKECIKNGIAKININTELKKAWAKGVREILDKDKEQYDPVLIEKNTEKYIKEVVSHHIIVFGSEKKA